MKKPSYLVFFAMLLINTESSAISRSLIHVDLPIMSCMTAKNELLSLDLSQRENGASDLIFTHYVRNGDLRNWFNISITDVYQDKYLNGIQIYVPVERAWFVFSDVIVSGEKQVSVSIISKLNGHQIDNMECLTNTASRLPFLKETLFKKIPVHLRNFFNKSIKS